MTIAQKIEGLLFATGESMTKKKLASIFECDESVITEGIEELKTRLTTSGLVLIETDDTYTLGTHPELASLLEQIKKEELSKELSKASVETLAIILYRDGVTRTEIDYIRGVNSGFILRNLIVRGLIEKGIDPKDSRRTVYSPTSELFSYIGVTDRASLPEYATFSTVFAEQDAKMRAGEQ